MTAGSDVNHTDYAPAMLAPQGLTSELVDATDLAAVRELLDLKALVFHAPRVEEEDLAPDAQMLAQRGFRTTLMRDEHQAVAAFLAVDTTMSVPGGESVGCVAVTDVVVLPTHKRRGILRTWMTAMLTDAAKRGFTCAALHSAEAGIYGRYGYGRATARTSWTLRPALTRFLDEPTGRMRIIPGAEAEALLPGLDARARRTHAGSIEVSPQYWRRVTQQAPGSTAKDRSRWFAIHSDDGGEVDGLVSYSFPGGWEMGRRENRLVIHELRSATPVAERELWRHCAGIDFITEVTYPFGTPDLPLPWYLTDPRAAESGVMWDGQWTRILDVPAALGARRYPFPAEVVIEVTDALGLAGGSFALTVAPGGEATCEPVALKEPADLTLAVEDLSSLWLGGGAGVPGLADLAGRGDARLANESDLPCIAALFGWPVAPHPLTDF